MLKFFIMISLFLLMISGCSEEQTATKSSAKMSKCGAGKCGANMFDNNSALAKKKKNILKQMRENDPRKDCVIKANNTKEVYNCVRDSNTKKLSLKCGISKKKPAMKCGAGKCGDSTKK
ncbi:MAG: hypothetical protein QM497_08155 [Sulfurimonas sp.]